MNFLLYSFIHSFCPYNYCLHTYMNEMFDDKVKIVWCLYDELNEWILLLNSLSLSDSHSSVFIILLLLLLLSIWWIFLAFELNFFFVQNVQWWCMFVCLFVLTKRAILKRMLKDEKERKGKEWKKHIPQRKKHIFYVGFLLLHQCLFVSVNFFCWWFWDKGKHL